MTNGEDQDEMQHNAAFHHGLHCVLRLKQTSGTEIHHNLENYNYDPFKYTMGSPIRIVSVCMGKTTGASKGLQYAISDDILNILTHLAYRANGNKL